MTTIDGAIEWGKLPSIFYRADPELEKWTTQVWLNQLERGSNKNRFQCCLDSDGHIQYLRSIQGHSQGNRVDLSLQDNFKKLVRLD